VLIGSLGSLAHLSHRLMALPGAHAFAWLAGHRLRPEGLRGLNRSILRAVLKDIFAPEPRTLGTIGPRACRVCRAPRSPEQQGARYREQAVRAAPPIRVENPLSDAVPARRTRRARAARCAQSIHERILASRRGVRVSARARRWHLLIAYQAAAVADIILRHVTRSRGRHRGFAASVGAAGSVPSKT